MRTIILMRRKIIILLGSKIMIYYDSDECQFGLNDLNHHIKHCNNNLIIIRK